MLFPFLSLFQSTVGHPLESHLTQNREAFLSFRSLHSFTHTLFSMIKKHRWAPPPFLLGKTRARLGGRCAQTSATGGGRTENLGSCCSLSSDLGASKGLRRQRLSAGGRLRLGHRGHCGVHRCGGDQVQSQVAGMGLANKNVEWIDGRGTWWFYLFALGCARYFCFLCGFDIPTSWTLVIVSHSVITCCSEQNLANVCIDRTFT